VSRSRKPEANRVRRFAASRDLRFKTGFAQAWFRSSSALRQGSSLSASP
jgi:hypothetical protein